MTRAAELRQLGNILDVDAGMVKFDGQGLHINADSTGYKETILITRPSYAEVNANNALSTAWHVSPSEVGGTPELIIGSVAHDKEYAFSVLQDKGFGQRTSGGGSWATLLRMDGSRSNISGDIVIGASNATGFTTDSTRRLILYRGDSDQVGMQFQNQTTGTTAADGLGIGIDASENAFIWQYEADKSIYIGNVGQGSTLILDSAGYITYSLNNPRFTFDDDNGPNITIANVGGDFILEDDNGVGSGIFEVTQQAQVRVKSELPEEKPSLLLDFKNSRSLSPYTTFSRASTAWQYTTKSVLSEQNFMNYSENFSAWSGSRITVSSSSETAPDGSTNAYEITENTDNNWHYIFVNDQYIVDGNPGTYTWSVYAKAVSGSSSNWLLLRPYSPTDGAKNAWFDLANGVVGSETGAGVTRSMTDEGNGWYRCSITAPWTGAPNYYQLMIENGDGVTQYQGDGTSSILIFGAQLESGTLGPYVKTTGDEIHNFMQIGERVGSNTPRFDYDPETRESLGILIEEERTNHVIYSEDGAAMKAAGLQGNGTPNIISNAAVAPDGTKTAFKSAVDTFSQQYNYAVFDEGDGAGTYWTGSFYTKKDRANGHRYAAILILGAFEGAKFDLDTGTVAAVSTGYEAGMEDVGGGWYRCYCRNDGNAANDSFYFGSTSTLNGYAKAETIGSGNYMWGCQIERGPSMTSYIKTTGSTATRVPDNLDIIEYHFKDVINPKAFTIYGEWSGWKLTNGGGGRLVTIGDGSGRNQVWLIDGATSSGSHCRVYSNGSYYASFGSSVDVYGNSIDGSSGRAALAIDASGVSYNFNGAAGAEDTAIRLANYTLAKIGGQDSNTTNGKPNGHIQKIAIWDKKLTNENLRGLTEV